jgi:hypothetical protein
MPSRSTDLCLATRRGCARGFVFGASLLAAAVAPPAAYASAPAAAATAPAAAASAPAAAASAPADDEGTLAFHVSRVPRAAAARAPTAAPALSRPADMSTFTEESLNELHFLGAQARYGLNLFGGASLGLALPATGGHPAAFSVDGLDIVLTGKLGGSISAVSEINFEFDDFNEPAVDIERMALRWSSGRFFVDAGRFHTNLGYWNATYHHGRWLALPVGRPRWVAFEDEGGVLPVHFVGIAAGASVPLGQGSLDWMASVGNGRGARVEEVQAKLDLDNDKMVHLRAEYSHIGGSDLRIGVTGVYDRVKGQPKALRPLLPDAPLDEVIAGLHVAYPGLPVTCLAEGYAIYHWGGGQRWTTAGGFVLLGYAFDRVTPYVMLERMRGFGGADPYFAAKAPRGASGADRSEVTAGVRVDVTLWSSVKVQYEMVHDHAGAPLVHEGIVDWSFGI